MRSSIVLLLCVAILLAACSAQPPQVTVTSAPPTGTVIPTPTSNPQFAALQDQIAASGERFTLLSDGTVQDRGTTIPGLQVANDGKITITVDGEQVEIDPSIVNFDDENGLSIEGFEDADGDGEWVEATTIVNGLEVVIGDPDAQGNRPIVEFIPPDELSYGVTEEDWLARLDPTEIGYESGELNWVVNGATGAIELQNSDGEAVATWKEVGTKGKSTVVWDAQMMGSGDDHPFHKIGIAYEMSGGRPVDNATVLANGRLTRDKSQTIIGTFAFEFGLDWKLSSDLRVFSTDRTESVSMRHYLEGAQPEDFVTILTPDGDVKGFLVENIEGSAFVDPR